MIGRSINELLGSSADDPGCEETFRVLHEYVDAVLRGADVSSMYPRVLTHLENCPGCREDTEGLLAALREITPPPTDT